MSVPEGRPAAGAAAANQARQRWEPWNDPAAQPYIRIIEVTKRFGDTTALDAVSLDIYRGEFFALLGPSGCGKTTLLRILAGFETPTSGHIELDGVDLTAIPPYQRPVNMMFQSYALFPHMTVAQNIAFGLKQDRLPKREIAERVAEMLELVQLSGLGHRRPHQLSGGQRQRVALARSLVKRPKMLLLDEPLAALDKKLREHTQFELMNIQDRVGVTFVIVTHDQEEAMTVSCRMAVMNQGRIAQLGTPGEIYEYPNSRYVAEFIGDINLLEGRITESGANFVRIHSEEAAADIFVDRAVDAAVGATVWVAVRPEKFTISLVPPDEPAANCLSGQVWDIRYLGNTSVYHVQTAGGRRIIATQANRTRLVERPITWEDTVYLAWAPGAAVVLLS